MIEAGAGQRRKFLEKEPEPGELVARFARAHHRISEFLFVDRGMELVSGEGQIMFEILKRFVLQIGMRGLPFMTLSR